MGASAEQGRDIHALYRGMVSVLREKKNREVNICLTEMTCICKNVSVI
jgi:hypothetical protein